MQTFEFENTNTCFQYRTILCIQRYDVVIGRVNRVPAASRASPPHSIDQSNVFITTVEYCKAGRKIFFIYLAFEFACIFLKPQRRCIYYWCLLTRYENNIRYAIYFVKCTIVLNGSYGSRDIPAASFQFSKLMHCRNLCVVIFQHNL